MATLNDNFVKADSSQIALFNISINDKAVQNKSQSEKAADKQFAEYEEKFADYEQLVILFIAGWVISYTLAYKDSSQCLDDEHPGLDFTFRTWLIGNFALSMAITILFMFGVLFAVLRNNNYNIISYPCGILFVLGGIGKIIWILTGAVIFIYHLKFDRCSDFVITYCSGQFIVFISALAFFIMKLIYELMVKFIKCCQNKNNSKIGSSSDKLKGIQKFINETGLRIKKQLAFWGMIGWVYALVLAKKDKSICLDEKYEHITITFREWFLGDGITTLISLLMFTLLVLYMKFTMNNQANTQELNLFDKLLKSAQWIKDHHVIAVLFICSVLIKFFWMLIGLSMYFAYLNIENCKGFMIDYLMLYFVWFIYLGVIFLVVFMDLLAEKCGEKKSLISKAKK